MKVMSVIVLWFTIVTTIALVFASCGTSNHACDAYGQVETEKKV